MNLNLNKGHFHVCSAIVLSTVLMWLPWVPRATPRSFIICSHDRHRTNLRVSMTSVVSSWPRATFILKCVSNVSLSGGSSWYPLAAVKYECHATVSVSTGHHYSLTLIIELEQVNPHKNLLLDRFHVFPYTILRFFAIRSSVFHA